MAREKLKDFLTSGGVSSTSDRLTFTLTDQDGDGLVGYNDDLAVDPGTGSPLLDLDSRATGLLGDFLKFIVDDAKNNFRMQGGNFEAPSSNRGDALTPAEVQGSEEVFVRAGTEIGSEFDRYSNSGKFDDTSKTLSQIINKTGPDDQSSHRLLSSVEGSEIDTTGKTLVNTPDSGQRDVTVAAQQILMRYNRFNPEPNGKAYSQIPTRESDFESGSGVSGTSTSQRDFGKYDPAGVQIVMNKLKSVGSSLLLKAAGWDSSVNPVMSADPDGFDFESASNPDPSDGSRGVSSESLRPKNASGAPEMPAGTSTRTGRGEFLSLSDLSNSTPSYGTTTTYGTQFSSANSAVLRAQAVGAIIAMMEACQILFGVIEDLIKSEGGNGSPIADLGRGPYLMGEADPSLTSRMTLLRRLVLVKTNHDYVECVTAGVKIFFSDGAKLRGSSDSKKISDYQHVQEAPGFWLSVARTVIRSISTIRSEIDATLSDSFDASSVSNLILSLGKTKIIGFMNVAATVGDSMLSLTGGNPDIMNIAKTSGPRDVDSFPNSPATRIAKSRAGDGPSSVSLAWRGSSVPSMYTLPTNIINAASNLGTVFAGTNPARGMLASRLVTKTYVDPNAEGYSARIRGDIVERMENTLDAEYVPFYFHDLRTNEIVAFHAFLKNLTESYSAQYGETTGYGRIDPVLTYNSTKRSINLTFAIAATSKEDFDEMWWKINKVVTFLYPQWTEGMRVSNPDADSTFIVPFSQVLSASPMVRLRVGDVIKSNYSKFNLARLFGVGNTDINPKTSGMDSKFSSGLGSASKVLSAIDGFLNTIFYLSFGSPVSIIDGTGFLASAGQALLSEFSVNGFANPAGVALTLRAQTDPDTVVNSSAGSSTLSGQVTASALSALGSNTDLFGYRTFGIHYLKPNQNKGYTLVDVDSRSPVGTKFYTMRPVRVMVIGREKVTGMKWDREKVVLENKSDTNANSSFRGPARSGQAAQKTYYKVMVIDLNAPSDMFGSVFKVTHTDITANYSAIFATTAAPLLAGIGGTVDAAAEALVRGAASSIGIPTDQINFFQTDTEKFMSSENNAIVRAFESTRGRGLPGFVRSLQLNWLQGTWETDWNSRAPKYAELTLQFDVVHDIPPGIDYSGYNRAPNYNVGDIMRSVSGDPYNDNGEASEDTWTSAGTAVFRSARETDN